MNNIATKGEMMVMAQEKNALLAQLDEWKERHKQAALNWQQENEECRKLQAQLAEAQRREQAAVEHLTLRNTMERVPCISCKKSCVDSKDYYCRDWVYCGPQEAKEAQHD